MKIFKLFFVLTVCLVLLNGCDDDNKNTFETDFPTWGENGPEGIETMMMVVPLIVGNRNASIIITTFIEPITWMLVFNGIQVDLMWGQYETEWSVVIDVEEMGSYGEYFTYEFELNGDTVAGSLSIPYCADVDWPVFDFNEDYEFNWTLQQNPDVQIVDLNIHIVANEYFRKSWVIDGDDKSFKMDKSSYENYQNNYDWVDIVLRPTNFEIFNETLILSSTFAGTDIEVGRKLDIKRIAKTIMENR